MPFTFAHPVAVLPLRRFGRGRLVWSALVIGTIAPDLEYFIRLTPRASLTASLPTGFAWDLAGGLLLFVIFQELVKKPATLLMPGRHRRALWPVAAEVTSLTVGRGFAIGTSLFIGAGTHRLWDSFTHRDGWAVTHIEALRVHLFDVGSYPVATFNVLQHGSTLVGFVALGLVYHFWLVRQPAQHSVEAPALRPGVRLVGVVVVHVSALGVGVLNALLVSSSASTARSIIVHLGIGAITGGVLVSVFLGMVFRIAADRG